MTHHHHHHLSRRSSTGTTTTMILHCWLLASCAVVLLPSAVTAFTPTAGTTSSTSCRPSRSYTTSTTSLAATMVNKVDVRESAPRNGYSFMEWGSHYGIQPENFQLQPMQGDLNWGAVATRPARAGERALFVPSMLRMFTPNIIQQEFPNIQPIVQQKIASSKSSNGDIDLANHFYLFLKVLKEYELGSESPYFAWLDALPRKFQTAVNFRDVETDCLPPFVKFLSKRDQQNYSLFARTLQELSTPDTISDATKQNMELTKWAFNVVFTRARESFGAAEIIPMSDMINHRSEPNVEITWDNEGNVNVIFVQDVQAGEELVKCYGREFALTTVSITVLLPRRPASQCCSYL